MKQQSRLLVILFFVSGFTIAQSNEASISQVDDDDKANITQSGENYTGYVDQVAVVSFHCLG